MLWRFFRADWSFPATSLFSLFLMYVWSFASVLNLEKFRGTQSKREPEPRLEVPFHCLESLNGSEGRCQSLREQHLYVNTHCKMSSIRGVSLLRSFFLTGLSAHVMSIFWPSFPCCCCRCLVRPHGVWATPAE